MKNRQTMPGFQRPRSGWILLVRVVLATVFLYAGTAKLLQTPEGFADGIASFRLLPGWAISPLALTLPPLEVFVGCMLLTGQPRRLGAFCALLLGFVFLLALALAMARGIPVDCGCFGHGPSWLPLTNGQRLWLDLGRDILMVAGALIVYRQDAAQQDAAEAASRAIV